MPKELTLLLGPMRIKVQFYEEFLVEKGGCFPRDLACHALWYYYVCAMRAYDRARKNYVYEDELSLSFTVENSRNLLQTVANLYGQPVEKMVRFWDVLERQRIMLGGGDTLPSAYKFQFNIN